MSTKALTKKASAAQGEIPSLTTALKNGGPIVWLSCLIMGLANIAAGQFIKGLLFLAIEAAVIVYMAVPSGGLYWLSMLPSLGDRPDEKIWDDDLGVYVTVAGDRSQMILLYAVATIVILAVFVVIWRASVRSGYMGIRAKRSGEHVVTFVEDVKALFVGIIHKLLMALPFAFLLVFTIVPLIYMMLMAFTNYSKVDEHLMLFDWSASRTLSTFSMPAASSADSSGMFWSGP